MVTRSLQLIVLVTLTLGCAAPRSAPVVQTSSAAPREVASAATLLPVDYRDEASPEPKLQNAVAETLETPAGTYTQPVAEPLTLDVVEGLALANHPTVAQAQARIQALQGKWVQVGLAPNPTIGYLASEINSEGSAGQQGAFLGQDFITANKLQRNRAIACAEIRTAEQQLAIITRRVQTDVRTRFFNALLAQRRVELANELEDIASAGATTSKSLLDAAEIPLAGLLQSEMELQNALLLQQTSMNELDQAWRQLQTLAGGDWLPRGPLSGELRELPTMLNFDEQLEQLQQASPEVAAAMAEVSRSRRVLNRECVEAVPNVSTQVSVQYDDANNETLTGVQIGIPLPFWNRNQGAICKARAEVSQAIRNVDRVERDLQRRLADEFRQYANSRVRAETYATEILTRSERTLDLIRQGYAQGEVGYLDLLTAQRTFSQTNLAYLDALGDLWQSYLRIDGLLLEGSFEAEIPMD